jgi:hypothetical protein
MGTVKLPVPSVQVRRKGLADTMQGPSPFGQGDHLVGYTGFAGHCSSLTNSISLKGEYMLILRNALISAETGVSRPLPLFTVTVPSALGILELLNLAISWESSQGSCSSGTKALEAQSFRVFGGLLAVSVEL